MSARSIVSLRFPQSSVAAICIDTPGRSVNVLDHAALTELEQTIDAISQRELKGVVLFSAKPDSFIAGGDLKWIQQTADFSQQQVVEFCERGRAVMGKLSSLDFPSLAAIHGAALGSGLELAMYCDYRIASDADATMLGLPEVKVGLIPGWSGTIRLPRQIGFEKAVEMITTGRLIDAAEAAEVGLVDELVSISENSSPTETLLHAAMRFFESTNEEGWSKRRQRGQLPIENLREAESIVADAAEKLVANQEVYLFAPTIALEHLARTATLDAAASEESESIAMAQVYGSPANRGLLQHYFSVRHNRKHPGSVDTSLETSPLQAIGIVGAGLMGSSIATRAAQAGIQVRLLDANPVVAASAAERINAGLDGSAVGSVRALEDYDSIAGVDLVIESVVETLSVKTSVLQKVEAVEEAPKWLATNTSAIPIGSMSPSLAIPESFCGIHFCHPELMSLVEVICGPETAEQTVADAVAFVRQLGMMPVAINDCPGFVVNRLLASMLNESLKIYSEGYPIPFIDAAIREFGFLGGPFEIIDVIGADTCMYAGRSMWENGLKCVSLSPILPRMVKKNRLGRKTGDGFYRYKDHRGEGVFDPAIDEELNGYRKISSDLGQTSETASSLAVRILASMVNEASSILEEEIVADPRDIDLCIVHGLSFPTYQGGLLFWADQIGVDVLNEHLQDRASDRLKMMQREGRKFFDQSGI